MSTVGRFGAGWVTSFQRLNVQKARAARRRSIVTTLEDAGGVPSQEGPHVRVGTAA